MSKYYKVKDADVTKIAIEEFEPGFKIIARAKSIATDLGCKTWTVDYDGSVTALGIPGDGVPAGFRKLGKSMMVPRQSKTPKAESARTLMSELATPPFPRLYATLTEIFSSPEGFEHWGPGTFSHGLTCYRYGWFIDQGTLYVSHGCEQMPEIPGFQEITCSEYKEANARA